jgi:hypothetical protein
MSNEQHPSDKIGRITGTFLDEITVDIGSMNWSANDWRRDFEAMAAIGIDTVVIIRGGLKDKAIFPSKVVGNPYDPDLAQVFLDEAQRHNMRLFFGTYDTGLLPYVGESQVRSELEINFKFVDEVLSRYGGHPAFKGWYITHEVSRNESGITTLFREMATYLKEKTPDFPNLISPYYPGKILGQNNLSRQQFGESWRELLNGLTNLVDIIAFQDGTTAMDEYAEFLAEAQAFCREFSIEFWNNVESFDREMSYNFPPRDIRVITRRLRIAEPFVKKHITFEFSHFMSPNSSFPGAANLYKRYREVVLGEQPE